MTLLIAGILTVGWISVAYATGRNDTNFNGLMMGTQKSDNISSLNYSGTVLGERNAGVQSNDRFQNMIKTMKDNAFSDKAKAMENRDFNSMNNISDTDYNKMIDIMRENGYDSMANMMEAVNKEDMAGLHNSMMGR